MNIRSVSDVQALSEALQGQLAHVLVDQSELVELYLVSLLAGGHLLLIGPPGVAKTRSATSFAKLLDLQFRRVQFTPDLLPSDIVGAEIYNPKTHEFFVKEGPVFTGFLLADELNRAPAKVQSALLEAMQERQVTIAGITFPLPEHFTVVATMNPLDGQGTYPLPEASLDRFLLSCRLDLPGYPTEMAILRAEMENRPSAFVPLVHAESLAAAREVSRGVYADESVLDYVARLMVETRGPAFAGRMHGVSPRASVALMRASQARAAIRGREYVVPEDVKAMAPHVLGHRVAPSYAAESRGETRESLVADLLSRVAIAMPNASA